MSGNTTVQAVVVSQNSARPNQDMQQIALFKADGTAHVVPERAAARADVGALTSAQISGGESPTQAEHNAVQTDLATMRTAFNDLLAKLRTANVIAT